MADNNTSNDTTIFLFIGLALLGGWLFWYLLHEQIILALRWIRYGEMWVLDRIVDNPRMVEFQQFFAARSSTVSWPHIAVSSLLVGSYLRWPVAGILALCAAWVMFKAPKVAFRHAYKLDQLIAAQAKVWPIIAPIINFNPAEDNSRDPTGPTPDKLPVFAEALSPEEFMKFNRIARTPEGIDRDAATAAFTAQLGPRWKGAGSASLAVRALFAVCALKIARKREPADTLLGRLAQAIEIKGGMRFKPDLALRREIDRIIRDPGLGGAAEQVAARHAFVTPAMLHVLAHARDRGGVLAPAQFLWLRGVNRALWYPLNNLGRRAFHSEAAGAMAHYEAELAANRPLLTPKVKNAVDALEKYSHDNPFTPTLQLTG
jgi:intracellular multiplication protein IcmP